VRCKRVRGEIEENKLRTVHRVQLVKIAVECIAYTRLTVLYYKKYSLNKLYPEFQISHHCREEKAIIVNSS